MQTFPLDERIRWLFDEALPLWWERGYDHARGLFYEGLNDDASPVEAPRRSRVQSRQIYVFATAGAMGWAGPWREAVTAGVTAYLERYALPDGRFRTLVAADASTPLDDTITIYDQAFSLFALAAATACGVLPEGARYAHRLLQAMEAQTRDLQGLHREHGEQPWQANCHMHLLEAALAWEEIDGAGPWTELADRIADRCLSLFIVPTTGALREFFDAQWRPAEGAAGNVIEPGHNFEWAWLMERWGRLRGRADARSAARRLHQVGRFGVDQRGVTVDELDSSFAVVKPTARLWPQTEHLKSASILREEEVEAVGHHASDAFGALDLYISPAPPGLWRERLQPDGRFLGEYTRATSLYHITCALAEAQARRSVAVSPEPSV